MSENLADSDQERERPIDRFFKEVINNAREMAEPDMLPKADYSGVLGQEEVSDMIRAKLLTYTDNWALLFWDLNRDTIIEEGERCDKPRNQIDPYREGDSGINELSVYLDEVVPIRDDQCAATWLDWIDRQMGIVIEQTCQEAMVLYPAGDAE